jgi:hypothetical protein
VRVKDGTLPHNYSSGIVLGPPDLHELELPADDLIVLQAALVKAHLVNAEFIRGSAGKLYTTVKQALPHRNAKQLVTGIKSIYQNVHYSDVGEI